LVNGLGKSYNGHSYSDLRGFARSYTNHDIGILIAQRPEHVQKIGGNKTILFALFEYAGDEYPSFERTIYVDPEVDQWFDIFLKIDHNDRCDHLNVFFEDGRKYHLSNKKEIEEVEPIEEILLTDQMVEEFDGEKFEESEKLEEIEEVADAVNTGEE